MTNYEFKSSVWPCAVASFPSIKVKLTADFPVSKSHPDEVTQGDVVDRWREILADVAVEEAKAAMLELLRSEWQAPFALEEYPKAILAMVRRQRQARVDRTYRAPKMIDGEPTYRCRLCRDDGMVEVWSPAAHKAAREQPDAFIAGRISTPPLSVPCKCRAGDRMLHCGNGHRYGSDNPKDVGMVLYPGRVAFDDDGKRLSDESVRRQLVEILAERDANGPKRQSQIEYGDAAGFPT